MNKIELNHAISSRILELTESKDISIHELARRAEVRQSTINNILNEGKIPTLSTLINIAKGLNISVLELLDTPEINKKQPATIK